MTGFDESFRCMVCGGFWMQSWALTQAGTEKKDGLRRMGLKPDPVLYSGKCPKDGVDLRSETSELIPAGIGAKKCPNCGWWWLSGDSFFDLQAAIIARKNYEKWWGKPMEAVMLFAPAVLVVVMAVGLAYGVNVVRQRTQISVPAKTEEIRAKISYVGGGRVMIDIVSEEKISEIELVMKGEESGLRMETVFENGRYKAVTDGLKEGSDYIIRVGGRSFEFTARRE